MHDVDAAAAGVVGAVGALHVLDNVADEVGKLKDGKLVAVAEVDGPRLGRVHERDQAVDEVVDVLEGARLRAVAVHGQVFAAEGLDNKVGHDAAIEWVHFFGGGGGGKMLVRGAGEGKRGGSNSLRGP